MIHNIDPHEFHNEWKPRHPAKDDIVFGFDRNNVILRSDQTFFHYGDLDSSHEYVYLFSIDDTGFFLTDIPENDRAISLNINVARNYEPRWLGFACAVAWHLYSWRRVNRFCGVCGSQMINDGKERAMRCPKCGNIVYPRINPAVIVGILNKDNKILITQYAIRHGEYRHDALVAGYCEIGESIEDCIRREVKEETGLEVTNLRFYKSQPWPFSESILFGVFCDESGGNLIKIDRKELRSAVWKARDDAFDVPGNASLTAEMIQVFRDGKISYGE